MKKVILNLVIIFTITLAINLSAYSANEYYRSVGSGNWNATGTWQMSTNSGGTWIAATNAPTDTSGIITIQSPNTVTVTVNVSADQLTVNTGGIISINTGIILTIKDGSGNDLFLNTGGFISGSGTLQTQGADVTMDLRGTGFTAACKVNPGRTNVYDATVASVIFNGTLTIDAGATLAIVSGGYPVTTKSTVTNNGKIISNGGFFIIKSASFINNDTVRGSNVYFDSTTTLTGAGAYTANVITIRSPGNVLLGNNVTFSPTSSFTINSGGIFNPNTRTFTQNSGTFELNTGGTVSNSGIFQIQTAVTLIIRNSSFFNAPFKVNTGTTTIYNDGGPNVSNFYGTMTVDAGATMTTNAGGYTTRAYGIVTNNGTISGNAFSMRGASISNNGTINPANFQFDSTTSLTSTGTWTGANITVGGTGNLTLVSNVTFTPGSTFTINNGGTFAPGSKTFTFASGSFVLNSGAVVTGVGVNAGIMQSQNNVTFLFRNGSTFNSAIKVNTGTLTAYNDGSPFIAVFSGNITVDAGATLTQISGGYTTQAMNNVINNGTITSPAGGNSFRMRGASFINNSVVSGYTLTFDSTTSLFGSGTYTPQFININSPGNVSLANDVTLSPTSSMTINNGGILNPNTRTLTYNSGTMYVNSGATVSNSGTFQTRNAVSLIVRNGSNFNAPLKVNTGTTTSYDDGSTFTAIYKGTITVDAGTNLITPAGGYSIQGNKAVTNNGTINTPGGAYFRMRGASLANNGLITGYYLNFDSTTAISGTGTYTSYFISINSTGNVSLSNNLSFTPGSNFVVYNGGILNPNTFTFTFASGAFYVNSGGTVSNSGIFQTQNNINLVAKSGSNFNAPLKVNTGTTRAYDDGSPYFASLNGTVTTDTGATLTTPAGGYGYRVYGNITNNGTLTNGDGANVRFYGANFINNGTVSANPFYFDAGAHNLSGTGSWTTTANILTGATVSLTSNHQMNSVAISSGGTFNLSTYKLSLTASNPISNSGTFSSSSSTIEYNGLSTQSISTTAIIYNKLRINNSSGVSLPSAITVNDTLSVILGDLNVGTSILTIAPTGYLTETAGNTVTGTSGYVTTTRTLNAPSAINVGGLGAVLTTAVNLGSTEVRRGFAAQSGLGGNTSILRYFDITPTTNTGLNATLVYKYDESELNGKVESALSLYKSINSGISWTSAGGTVNASLNQITVSGLSTFSRWSASSASAVTSTIKFIIEGFYNSGTSRLNKKDTVRAYLRNNIFPYAIVDSAVTRLDSVTFAGNFLFANAGSGTYYVQVNHRNTLQTWSKSGGQPYTLGSAFSYDFTTALSQAYGNNMVQVSSSPVREANYSGDINQDEIIDATDVSEVENAALISLSGYVKTDLTGDDYVDASDLSVVENNASLSVSVQKP